MLICIRAYALHIENMKNHVDSLSVLKFLFVYNFVQVFFFTRLAFFEIRKKIKPKIDLYVDFFSDECLRN